MASTESGWTKEFPKVDGIYWYRWHGQSALFSIAYGKIWTFNWTEEQHPPLEDAEWLGPISPSDAEQLIQLRKLVREFLTIDPAKDVARWCEIEQKLERLVGIDLKKEATAP